MNLPRRENADGARAVLPGTCNRNPFGDAG